MVFTGLGNDLVDTSTGAGSNRIYGGSGQDEIIFGTGDRGFGGADSDILDASSGGGNNRLYGGAGNDRLLAGGRDRLIAGEGNDELFVTSGGDNILTGGNGEDIFRLANAEFPDSVSTITDYEGRLDLLSISGLGLAFSNLNLASREEGTVISANGNELAFLLGIQPENLSEADFVFA